MKLMTYFRLTFFTNLVLLLSLGIGLTYASSDQTGWEGLTQPYTASRRVIPIQTPILDEMQITKYVSGIRPINDNCPKIEAKVVHYNEKRFVSGDCWGHGGAGLTLAPGSAKMIYEKVSQTSNLNGIALNESQIAILGGGINGLWTTYHFLKQGIPASHLTVYANDFEATVSHIAAGMWLPISMPRDPEKPEFFKVLEDDSYHAFYAIANKNTSKIKGVVELPLYTFNMEKEAAALAERGLVPKGEPVILRNQADKEIEAVYWKGFFLVDPTLLMPSLKKYLEGKGVKFQLREFSNEAEFFDLNSPIVVNCLGWGNKNLLEEAKESLKPSKGELIHFQPQPNINYMLFGVIPDKGTFGFIPRDGELVVGVTRKPGDTSSEPNEEDAKQVLQSGREFLGYTQEY